MAEGAHLLGKSEVEKLLPGARMSLSAAGDGMRSWTHGVRGHLAASMERPGASRPLNGQGTASVDASGAYCVKIEWPRTLESWCRRIVSLNGGYYGVSDDPDQTQVVPLKIVHPNPNALGVLGRLWSLVQLSPGATR